MTSSPPGDLARLLLVEAEWPWFHQLSGSAPGLLLEVRDVQPLCLFSGPFWAKWEAEPSPFTSSPQGAGAHSLKGVRRLVRTSLQTLGPVILRKIVSSVLWLKGCLRETVHRTLPQDLQQERAEASLLGQVSEPWPC